MGYNPSDPFGVIRMQALIMDMASACIMLNYMFAAGVIYASLGRR
jgi:hypothetical protein